MTSERTYSPSESIAEQVIADGFDVHRDAVAAVVVEAESCGVDTTLIGVLGDAAAPTVVRERALGMILSALAERQELAVHHDDAAGQSPKLLPAVTDLTRRAARNGDQPGEVRGRACA